MGHKTLEDLYLDQMNDLHSACRQAMPLVTDLGRAADARALTEALLAGNQGIARGIEVLAELCGEHGTDPADQTCKGMEGLVAEARGQALETAYADGQARDAAIIAQYRRMAHYAIAGYGMLLSLAQRLDLPADAARLRDCLDRTRSGDLRMTALAEGDIGAASADDG